MATVRANLARQLEVFSTLRFRNFRLFWIGLVAQVSGQQVMMFTIGWLAYEITGSPLTLGIVNLLQALPRIVLNLVGGALADRFDQRLLITLGQGLSALILVVMAYLVYVDRIEVWHLALGGFLIGLAQSFDEPSRQSLFPHLLPDRSAITSAVPLISMAWQFNRIAAPAVAGYVIAWWGAGSAFALAAMGAAGMAIIIRLLHVPKIARPQSRSMLRLMAEGAAYVWTQPLFRIVVALAYVQAIFVLGYVLTLPIFQPVFDIGPEGLGYMYTATGIGGLISLSVVPRIVKSTPPGTTVLVGLLAFSGAIIGFALSPWFPLALVFLLMVGFTVQLYLASSEIILQTHVPDQLRGRVIALLMMLWSLMPLGGALLNVIANFTGARIAMVIGASVVIAFTLFVGLGSRALRAARLPAADDPAPAH